MLMNQINICPRFANRQLLVTRRSSLSFHKNVSTVGSRGQRFCALPVTAETDVSRKTVKISQELLPDAAKGLVFDCDGTVVDSMGWHYEAWKYACDRYGLHMSPQLLVDLAGTPADALFDIVAERSGKAGQVDKEEFMACKRGYYTIGSKRILPLIEPVMDILRVGKERGLKLAIASGGDREHVCMQLEDCGILDLFDAIVTCEDVARGKPAPDGFLLASKLMGVEPELCVGYEDAVLGMEAIGAAGFMAAVDVTKLPGYPHLVEQYPNDV